MVKSEQDADSDADSDNSGSSDDEDNKPAPPPASKRAPTATAANLPPTIGSKTKADAGFDDLLGLQLAAPAPAAAPVAAAPAEVDLSAFYSPGASATAPPPQDMDKHRALLTTNQGVLFEYDALQIGVKMQVDGGGSQCKMILYYGNKDAAPLTNVSLTLAATPKLRVQVKPETLESLPPKQQTPQYLLWHCMQPFDEAPTVTISFTRLGVPVTLSLVMPLLASKFAQPVATDPATFVASWKATANEAVEVFRARDPIDIAAIRKTLSEGMNFALIDNLDKNPAANVVCSGNFHTATKNAAGELVTMPILVRIETNAQGQGFRMTIRSGHKLVTEAFRRAVMTVFAAV